MKTQIQKLFVALALLALFTLNSQLSTARAQGTAFTYQGRLNNNGAPASGSYDLTFTVFAANAGGVAITGPVTNSAVSVTNGLFTTTVDFGNVFTGGSNWLQIAVSTSGANTFSPLIPRQQLTPVPYSIFAETASNAVIATTATSANSATTAGSATTAATANNFSGALAGDVTGTQGATVVSTVGSVTAANVAGGASAANAATSADTANTIVKRDGSGNFSAGTITGGAFSGSGANVTGVNAASLGGLGAAKFWQTGGNTGANPTNGAYLGTADNYPLEFHVNGQRALRLEYVSSFPDESVNVIGGSSGNSVSSGIYGATIGGGGDPFMGQINTIHGDFGTIGGGEENTASTYATVAGGFVNTASGYAATVAGGYVNTASGDYSFAAGINAHANNDGAFVWADTQGGNYGAFSSTNNDSFNVRAQGGARFETSGAGMTVDGPVTATSFTGPASGLTGVAVLNGDNTFSGNQIINGGKVGIGTANPFTQLANTANNIYGSDGFGLSSQALGWYSTSGGYAAGFYNSENNFAGDGVVVSVANSSARILDLLSGGNSVMVVNGNGRVGIGTNTPSTALQVNGTVTANGFSGSGSGLTGVALLASANTFNGTQIITGGNVGIGTATPTKALLEVEGNVANVDQGAFEYYNISGTPAHATGSPTGQNYSIWASDRIAASEFNAYSDARIKNIHGQSDSAADLKTLLGIKITDYTYKDTVAKGDRPQKKVIAQQVEQVYPQAVSKSTGEVPDIYKPATIKDGWIQLATDLKAGERVKLIGESGQGIYQVLEVRLGEFRTAFKTDTDHVFVFGRQVDDFRSVDYEALSTLNISATQELAKRLAAETTEVDTQKTENVKLQAQVTAMQSQLESLQKVVARLAAKSSGSFALNTQPKEAK